ncbi:MAG: calcium-translocating P-type ATPase, PMCA-type [Bacillota bacterium]
MHPHAQSPKEVLKQFDVDQSKGLSDEQVQTYREKYGENVLKETKGKSLFGHILDEAKEFMNILLVIAAFVSMFASGHLRDGLFILAVVVFNITLSVIQTRKAENAVEALQAISAPKARVQRNNKTVEIPREDVVTGDIAFLEAGDFIPADMRLLESHTLKIDESTLTGESVPVRKDADVVHEDSAILSERKNMAYSGTLVTYGRAVGIVTATGMDSELGAIASLLSEVEDTQTPLQKRVGRLGRMLGTISVVVVLVIFLVGLLRNMDWLDIFMISVSLAVAAIPEGLPAVITVILALGMRKMASQNAIVKSLSAVETLGSVTVISTDKTGTLTENKMTVTTLYVDGNVLSLDEDALEEHKESLKELAEIGTLANDAKKEGKEYHGDPTETALLDLYERFEGDIKTLRNEHTRLEENPFDSERKMMSTINDVDGHKVMMIKGAPDVLLERCTHIKMNSETRPITDDDLSAIKEANKTMADQALRVLAFAKKPVESKTDETEDALVFIGLSGMIDPPREEVKESIRICRNAGIRVVMITGDHKLTASAIAKDLNISDSGETLDGREIEAMDDKALAKAAQTVNVYARVAPAHKVRIVSALQKNGEISSMTGDGVNDAPALKKADIGVAMGIVGTDVSKEAADMVLTDDNFTTIVKAVESGRVIYQNIRKFVAYLISCNIGEVLLIFVAIMLGWGSPLLPLQILWVNLVTDTLPAFALGLEQKEDDVMKRPPIDKDANIIDRFMGITVAFQSVFLATAVLISYQIGLAQGEGYAMGTTFAFTTLIVGELLRTFSARSEKRSIFTMNPFANKWVNLSVAVGVFLLAVVLFVPGINTLFQTDVDLTMTHLAIATVLGILPVLGGETAKRFKR